MVWKNIKGDKLFHKCLNRPCNGKYWSARINLFKLSSASNLSIGTILSIIWYWASGCTVKYTSHNLELNKTTVIQWFRKIRTYLYHKLSDAPPFGGTNFSVQTDESLFRVRRKYNRGRLLLGNKQPKEAPSSSLIEELKRKVINNRNYGKRVEVPWVFGMVCQQVGINDQNALTLEENRRMRRSEAQTMSRVNSYTDQRRYERVNIQKLKSQLKEVRMFVVERRDAKTLIPLITRHVKPSRSPLCIFYLSLLLFKTNILNLHLLQRPRLYQMSGEHIGDYRSSVIATRP